MKKILNAFKNFNWKLFLVLVVVSLVPALYQTLRIYFLGNMPNEYGVNIASQLSWVNLLYEIIQEAFILPLFYLLGKSILNKEELENKTKTGLLISGFSYLILSIIIIIFAKPLCEFMASDKNVINETITYIRLETIASVFMILSKFITVLLVTLSKEKYMYFLLFIQMVLSIVLDTFFLSSLKYSLNLGVNGIAFSNIIVSIILVILSLLFLRKEDINIFNKEKLDFKWLKEYGKIALFSGLESFIRNIAFMLMISRLVNVIMEEGTYWVSNNFIWTWLLLPSSALYDVIKKETAENKENIRYKTLGYLILSLLFSFLWFLSIPLWKPFIKYVLNASDVDTIIYIVLIQSGFYIIYIFNCIFDGTIYGRGKTLYMLIESICTNCIYYLLMFILWKTGIFVPTLKSISLMFGVGMAVDFIPTLICYLYLLKKENVKLKSIFE